VFRVVTKPFTNPSIALIAIASYLLGGAVLPLHVY
jgi:hypothetical protein